MLLPNLQIYAVGGNQRARTFFKQHGWSELGSDKIEQKVCAMFWGSYNQLPAYPENFVVAMQYIARAA